MQEASLETLWRSKIAEKGGVAAKQALSILVNDPELTTLKPYLDFVSANWSDPLRPALMGLSCQAVDGKFEDTTQTATALCLMNLSFFLWDDAIDKAPSRLFKPTFFGAFGEEAAIIMGGLASAKAFNLLSTIRQNEKLKQAVNEEVWKLWSKMAQAETASLSRRNNSYRAKDKLSKIQKHATTNLATCLRIGALIGDGSQNEIRHLGKYGLYLGTIIDLRNDFRVATNQTVELVQKIKSGSLPYSVLWAKEHSHATKIMLTKISQKEDVEPSDVAEVVGSLLQAGVKEEIMRSIRRLSKKAVEELSTLKKCEATLTLKSFAEAQPKLFAESLRFRC